MTKKLKGLEKETALWKQRWEKSNCLLTEMALEKKQRDSELLSTTKQLAQLEKLCRAMQTERVSLIAEIKSSKINAAVELGASPDSEDSHSRNIASASPKMLESDFFEQPCKNMGTNVSHANGETNSESTEKIEKNIPPPVCCGISCAPQEGENSPESTGCCVDSSSAATVLDHSKSLVHPPSSSVTTDEKATADSASQDPVVFN